MFDVFIKVLSIVFKPLFDASKDAILKSSEPRRKLVQSLLKLYEEIENVEGWSQKLLNDAEDYISKDWVAWTVARNKRQVLIQDSEELRKAANSLGQSLHSLYRMLNIQNPELLGHLIGIHQGKKSLFIGRPMATPTVIDKSESPKQGALYLLQPKDNITALKYDNHLLSSFYRNPEEIKKIC